MRHWPITRIPHVVDAQAFSPMPMAEARQVLGLPQEVPILLFLASAGIHDRRKGWDLLDAALARLTALHPDTEVMIVGPTDRSYSPTHGVRIHWLGQVSGDEQLRLHYSASTLTVVPSREDNMPLTAMEAQTCGRAVVAFSLGGLPDIVEHGISGALAQPFNTESLVGALDLAITRSTELGWNARERALRSWSNAVIAVRYLSIYEDLIS